MKPTGLLFLLQVFVYLTAAVFVSSAFGIVSTLTLLGFITVQYFAICRPMQHMSLVRKKRVVIFLLLSWAVTVLGACMPFVALLVLINSKSCTFQLLHTILLVVIMGANICIAIVAIIYTCVIGTCLRIYIEIRHLQKRLSQFRFDQDVRREQNAFVTTLLLMATLTIFFIPYTSVYVVSLNNSQGEHINSRALIYYMNILPYIKFFSDPLIYGLRMKEIHDGCWRFAYMCRCHQCCGMASREHMVLSRVTSYTASTHVRSMRESATSSVRRSQVEKSTPYSTCPQNGRHKY